MCNAPFWGRKVKGSFKFWLCPLRGFPVWLNHFICGIHTTHERAMCSVPFWGRKGGWRAMCHASFFRMKGQRSGSQMSFEVFVVSASCLPPYLTESHHMWHTYNTWRGDVPRTIFRMKGRRSRLHGSFEVFVVSTPWLPPYCHLSALWLHAYLSDRWRLKGAAAFRSLDLLI